MSLFKILRGDSSRISMDVTEFHEGYAYFTPDDGGFYIDAIADDEQKRIRVSGAKSGKTTWGQLKSDGTSWGSLAGVTDIA
jgi:hypothetical protein